MIDVAVTKLSRDLVKASATLTSDEIRFLVDSYYTMQRDRIRAGNQVRSLVQAEEPHSVLSWLMSQSDTLEGQIKRTLDAYSNSKPLGQWARSIVGVGPVIAAGLLAHIDIEKAPTVGHIWRFAGLDPTSKWNRGEKRPFNATLKTLCWKIGESFVKVKGNENDVYGKVYEKRKQFEIDKNNRGEYADQAAAMLKSRPTHAQKTTYAEGRLPDGHIHARAKRYTVKLFLAHYHEVGWTLLGKPVPLPYPIAFGEHVHKIEPPNMPLAKVA
jgi:hypothetical protein